MHVDRFVLLLLHLAPTDHENQKVDDHYHANYDVDVPRVVLDRILHLRLGCLHELLVDHKFLLATSSLGFFLEIVLLKLWQLCVFEIFDSFLGHIDLPA